MRSPVDLTFLEHLEELRRRLLVCLAAVGMASAAGYFFSERAIRFLVGPLKAQTDAVYFFSPTEAFTLKVKVALLLGLAAAAPVILGELWLFVAPALHEKEKKVFLPLVFISSILFFTGVVFCFFIAMPFALKFLVGMQSDFLKPLLSVSEYMGFLFGMMLAFGIAFNMPLLILALVFLGFLDVERLNRYQRHVIVLIFIAAAVLTPGPDVASQMMLAVPLLVLFEISVLGAKLIARYRTASRGEGVAP